MFTITKLTTCNFETYIKDKYIFVCVLGSETKFEFPCCEKSEFYQ